MSVPAFPSKLQNAFRNSTKECVVCLVLVVAVAALFGALYHAGFVNMDDQLYVDGNYHVTTGLSWQNFRWAFQAGYASNWHPLTWLSHMLDCQLFGAKPGIIHIVNVGFHCANSVLLFLAFNRMTRATLPSAFVALLFAVHPLHVQSVAWISERKDVLSTFFGFLSMLAYIRYTRLSSLGFRRAIGAYLLCLSLFAFALMSKPMLVTLPFMFLLLDFWPLRRLDVIRPGFLTVSVRSLPLEIIWEKIPMLVMSGLTAYVTTIAQKRAITDIVPFGERVANALFSYVRYLGKMIWPVDLTAYYPYARIWHWWEVPGSLLLLLLISIIAVRLARSRPYLLCGWLWFLGGLVPVIGLVQVGAAAMADRYTYLPLVGIFFGIVWCISDIKRRLYRLVVQGGSLVVVASFVWCTYLEVPYWKSPVDLFQKAVLEAPNNFFALKCLGSAYSAAGSYGLAARTYERALHLFPKSADVNYYYGNTLVAQGKYAESLPYYDKALAADPEYADVYFNRANSLGLLGRFVEAEENYAAALRYNPDLANAEINLATTFVLDNKLQAAISHYEQALKLDPKNPDAHFLLGSTFARDAKWDAAVKHFRLAVDLNPSEAGPINDLAWILATTRIPEIQSLPEAVTLAEKACSLTGFANVDYLDTLAVAYAKVGRTEDAIRCTKTARQLSLKDNPRFALLMEQRLRDYESGRVGEFHPVAPQISPKQLLSPALKQKGS